MEYLGVSVNTIYWRPILTSRGFGCTDPGLEGPSMHLRAEAYECVSFFSSLRLTPHPLATLRDFFGTTRLHQLTSNDRPYCLAVTLPAGYLGSSLIGAALIACGFDTKASKIACLVLAGFFILTLWWARRSLLYVDFFFFGQFWTILLFVPDRLVQITDRPSFCIVGCVLRRISTCPISL